MARSMLDNLSKVADKFSQISAAVDRNQSVLDETMQSSINVSNSSSLGFYHEDVSDSPIPFTSSSDSEDEYEPALSNLPSAIKGSNKVSFHIC